MKQPSIIQEFWKQETGLFFFKTAVKEIAYKHGIMATFMAKVNEHLPGCGGHVHQSLWDADKKKNLFYDEKDSQKMSEIMKHYIAGQLLLIPHIISHVCANHQ